MRASIIVSVIVSALVARVSAVPTHETFHAKKGHPLKRQSPYPFSQVVAFGDNLSDNGNGSYAYGFTNGSTIYGARTWTDGPVAVSYLVDMLGVPLKTDYAVGHRAGGSKFGATINNTYTNSTAGAPDAFTQVANYTSSGVNPSDIADTMHFLWIGSNDISLKHIYVWGGFEYVNQNFANNMARQMAELVQQLLDAGSKTVFVPNLYPKDIAPAISFMCTDDNGVNLAYLATLDATIDLANAAIQAALLPFGDKAIYYDVNSFMKKVMRQRNKYGITHAGTPSGLYEFCDGYSQEDWDLCVTDKQGDTFYWMQYLDMTTYVHQLVAQDMFKTIKAHFAA